jgi:hypothetical protein
MCIFENIAELKLVIVIDDAGVNYRLCFALPAPFQSTEKFSAAQKDVYHLVLNAQAAAIAQVNQEI